MIDTFDWHKGYATDGFKIPEYMLGGLERYVMWGLQPGDFLTAVICNDLFKAVGHADSANLINLPAFVKFFYNVAPHNCYGSSDQMRYWIRVGGWNGLQGLDSKYPGKGGICDTCEERDDCPMPVCIRDETMAIDLPDYDEAGAIEWCPCYVKPQEG